MNINWMRIALVVLFATLAVTLIADFAAAEGDDNENTITASAKLGAGIALAGCGIGTGLSQGQVGAAGVGTIGIVDFDIVDLTNLQRQILHRNADVGRPKVDSATDTLKSINPDVNVISHPVRLSSKKIFQIISDYDVVVDGSDNFPTRYLVNDACVMAKKPNVHGSIFLFEGQKFQHACWSEN